MSLNKIKKTLSSILTLTLVLHQLAVPLVYAQEATPEPSDAPESGASPTPIPTPENTPEPTLEPSPVPTIEPTPEPTPEPTIEPTPEPSDAPESGASPSPLLSLAPSPTPSPSPLLSFSASNSAEVDQVASTSATTGLNQAQAQGSVNMISGDAVAIANVLQAINTQSVQSQLAILAITPKPNESGDIDLNELWQQMQAIQESIVTNSSKEYPLIFTIFNQADIHTIVFANADTGQNSLTSEAINLQTGSSLAIANVGQLINADLFNAQVFFSMINILPGFTGNIILPRPPDAPSTTAQTDTELSTTSSASSSASLQVNANSGDNSTNGTSQNMISTGNATALGSSMSFINTTIINSFLYSFIINNLSNQDISFLGANSTIPQNSSLQLFTNPYTGGTSNENQKASLTNQTTVETTIISQANTGLNSAVGAVNSITTGTAKAVASLIEFTNTTVINGSLFSGIANIASDWFGKVIIAHPDLTISISPVFTQIEPGNNLDFTLTMSNKGYDRAISPVATITLPDQMSVSGTTCTYPHTIISNTIHFQLPDMPKNTSLTCQVTGFISQNFTFEESQARGFSFVKQAYAASHTQETQAVAMASIETSDKELDTRNNQSRGQFTVFKIDMESEDTPELNGDIPSLSIESSHNVNEYVYAGDTVTFFIKVTNTSSTPSRNSYLAQTIYDPTGTPIGRANFKLGTINKGGTLTFGITLPKNSITGVYSTLAQAFGETEQGMSVASNKSSTTLRVNGYARNQVFAATPNDPIAEPAVLGALSTPICVVPFNVIPYLVIIISSALWFSWTRKQWDKPLSNLTKTFYLGTVMFMLTATTYAIYTIGRNYGFINEINALELAIITIRTHI